MNRTKKSRKASFSSAYLIRRLSSWLVLTTALTLGASKVARAATTYTWGSGATGNWSVAGDWTPTGPADGAGNIVNYTSATASASITLDSSRTIGQVSMLASTRKLSILAGGGTLTIDNTGGTTNLFGTNDGAIEVDSAVTGTDTMSITAAIIIANTDLDIGSAGAGAITGTSFTGAITATSARNLNFFANGTGAVAINSTIGASGSGITVQNVGTGAGTVTLGGVLGPSVAGVVQNSATSGLTLTAANTFTSNIQIINGSLTSSSNVTPFGTGAGSILLGDTTVASLNSASLKYSGTATTISNPIVVEAGSSGTLSIIGSANSNTFTGAISLNNSLTVDNTTSGKTTTFSTGTLTEGGSGDLVITKGTGVGAVVFSAPLVLGAGGLTFANTGAGTLTESGAVSSATTGGLTLKVNSTGSITLGAGSINPAGIITNSGTGSGTATISGIIGTSVTGVQENSTTSPLVLGAVANTWTGGLFITAGTVTGANNAATFGGSANVITLGDSVAGANASLVIGNGSLTLPQAITVSPGGGTRTIAGTGITSGTATIFSGPVTLNHDLILQTATANVAPFTFSGGFSGTGNLMLNNLSTTAGGGITVSGSGINITGSLTNQGNGTQATLVSGNVNLGTGSLVQNTTGANVMTLSGATVAYTGATTVTAGTLNITANTAPLTTSSVTVAGGATWNVNNGLGQTINLGSGALNLGTAAATAVLGFDVGNSSNYDNIVTTGAAVTAGTIKMNVTPLAGFGGGATYTLLSAASGLSGATYTFNLPTGFNYVFTDTDTSIAVTATTTAAGKLYWKGAIDTNWNSVSGANSNFTTDLAGTGNTTALPGVANTVVFSTTGTNGTTLTTNLQAAFSINDLVFNNQNGTLTAITVGSGTGTNVLTISPVNTSSADGINLQTGAPGAVALSANTVLGSAQTWTVADSTSTLTVSGVVSSGSGLTNTSGTILSTAGAGTIVLSGTTNTFLGDIVVGGTSILSIGALGNLGVAGSNGTPVNTPKTVTIQNGATFKATASLNPGAATAANAIFFDFGQSSTDVTTLNAASGTFQLDDAGQLTINGTLDIIGSGIVMLSTQDNSAATTTFGSRTLTTGVSAGSSVNVGGTATLSLRVGANVLGGATYKAPITLNTGTTLDLRYDAATTVGNNVTLAGNATILSGRNSATAAAGVTHTLGTLSIGSQTLTLGVGNSVTTNTAYGLTFGATTFTGNSTFNIGLNGTGIGTLTLGTLSDGGTARTVTKSGAGTLLLNTPTAALTTGGFFNITNATLQLNANEVLGGASGYTVNVGDVTGSNSTNLLIAAGNGTLTESNPVAVPAGNSGVASVGTASGVGIFNGSVTISKATALTAAANTIAIFDKTISDAGSASAITKTGAGEVILLGNQGYTGGTTVTAGLLVLSTGYSNVTVNGGSLELLNGATVTGITIGASGGTFIHGSNAPDLSAAGELTWTGAGTFTVDTNGFNPTYASGFGDSSGTFVKVGAGNLTLQAGSAGDTFAAFTPGAGTTTLDFTTLTTPANGVITGTTTVLTLRGGTLTLNGVAGTDTQTFSNMLLLDGGSTIGTTGNGTITLALGPINRDGTTNKGTVNFALPTAGSFTTSSSNNTSGILGGWATVGGTNWATVSAGAITALSSEVALPVTGGSATTNYVQSTTTAITLTASETINALRMSGTGGVALATAGNLTVSGGAAGGSGGILASATSSITSTPSTTLGFLTAGNGNELLIYTNTGVTLTISAAVGGPSGAVTSGLTKSGNGTLVLGNASTTQANNYVGVTTIDGGTISISVANQLGGSTGITLNGGTLTVSANISVTQPITIGLNGGTLNYTGGAGNAGWTSATAIAFLGSGSRTLNFNDNNASRFDTLSAAIGDGGGPTSIVINASGDTGDLQFSGANSTYTGSTTITRGVLRLNAVNALSPLSNLIFNGGNSTNRAILENNPVWGSAFTESLGTGPGQVQWLGNGGFNTVSAGTTLTVNLGGATTPSQVIWGNGGFVPTGSTLDFAQASSNQLYGSGTVDFQNPIDLAGASRTVDVADNGGQMEAILSGVLSGISGSILNKSGIGTLTISGNNSTSSNVGITVTSGTVIFANANAVPGTTGTPVTINAGGSAVLTGSTNPLATIGSRIAVSSVGAIDLDTNSSAPLDFSTFTGLTLGAYNLTMGQPVIFTGSITPNANTYRLGTGRFAPNNGAAITGNNLVNFGLDAGRNVLVLPAANQLPDGSSARSLVVSAGETYITGYNTFTGGTKVGNLTGQTGSTDLAIGNDGALGAGLIQFNPTGVVASTGFFGAMNGDRTLNNNVSVGQLGSWVSSGNLASDGVANAAAVIYAGTTTLVGAVNIFARSNSSIFLGNIVASGTIGPQATGAVSFLTTPAGAASKTFSQAVQIAIGGNFVIDSNASLGTGGQALTIGTGTAAATNTFFRVQPGTSSVTLIGHAVAIGTNFQPVIDVPGGPVTGVTTTLILPSALTGTTTSPVTKIGAGTLTFQGANTFSSSAGNGLQIFNGTVLVDSATASAAVATNSITTSLALGTSATATNATYGNGGTFTISSGTHTTGQTFTILSSAAKDNAINLTTTTGSITLTFNGATFNRSQQGGTLAINTSTAGGSTSIVLSGTVTSGATTANQIVLDGGTSGNAFVYINGTDWAARNGTNQIIALGSAGAGSYTANTATVLSGNADMTSTTTSTTLAANTTVTSLRFNAATAETLDVNASNLITGGILVGMGIGTNNQVIQASGAGALEGIGGKDLVVINANTNGDGVTTGLLTISAPIADNVTATALTKSGAGTVVLAANNTFTGSIYLNSGVLSVASAGSATAANPLGQAVSAATNLIFDGGTLRYTGTGSSSTDRGATFNAYSNIDVNQSSGTFILTGSLNGIAGIPGLLNKIGTGTLDLGGGVTSVDDPNLSVLVSAGTLLLDKQSSASVHAVSGGTGGAALIIGPAGTVKITGSGGDQINNGSSVVVNGIFNVNGNSETIDALAGSGTVTNVGALSGATLTLGDPTVVGSQSNIGPNTLAAASAGVASTGLNSFSGTITDDGGHVLSLVKNSPGTQTLTYIGGTSTYTYSGDTSVIAGTLLLRAANLLPHGSGNGNVNLTGNTVIFGVTVPGTLDIGGFSQQINGLTGSAGSIVTSTPLASNASTVTSTLTLGDNDQSSTFAGIFQNGFVIHPGTTPVGVFGVLQVTKIGAGTLTLTGASTASGLFTVSNGEVDLDDTTLFNGSPTNALSSSVAVAGGTLKLLVSNQLPDTSTTTVTAGTFDIFGQNETVGVSLQGGSIIDSAGGGGLNSPAATPFDLQNGTVSAVLGGSSGLTKTTAGTVTLTKANSYTGATAFSGTGILVVSKIGSITASSGINLSGTGRFYVDGSTSAGVPVGVGAGATLGGAGTVSGTVTVTAGGIIEAGDGGTGSLTIGNLAFGGGGTINLFAINAGASASLVDVTGTMTTTGVTSILINAANPNGGVLTNGTYELIGYTGTIGGTGNSAFKVGNFNGLGGRQTATLDFGVANLGFISAIISGDSPRWTGYDTTAGGNSSVWQVSPSVTDWALITGGTPTDFRATDAALFDDSVLTAAPGGLSGNTTVDISNGDLTPTSVSFNNSAANYNLTGANGIAGTTSLVKQGTGTLTISNANSFTGGLAISAGQVILNQIGALGTANAVTFDAAAPVGTALILNGFNASITGLDTTSPNAVVQNGSASTNVTLTVTRATGTSSFAGSLQDGGAAPLALDKEGPGTLILAGTNLATGGNTIGGGTLQIGNGGATGSLNGDTTFTAAGTMLAFNRTGTYAYAGNISGAGLLTVQGGGTLELTGNAGQTGGTTIATGTTLQLGAGGGTGALGGTGNISDSGTLAFVRTGSTTVPGNITSTGALTVGDGTVVGTLILTGANLYSGTTTINASTTLQIGAGGGAGAIGTGPVVDNGSLVLNRSDLLTVAGAISGSGTVEAANGLNILAGTNTFSGGATVNLGATLQVGNGTTGTIDGMDGAAGGNIADSGTFALNHSGNHTWDKQVIGSGSVTIASGNWTFTNSNPYSTTAILNGATLTIGTGGSTGTIGSGAIANAGGLIFNRTDSYPLTAANLVTGVGTVTLANSGLVATVVDGQFNVGGQLIFGAANASTTLATLDLTNGGSSFGGALVRTNSASANMVLVGAGYVFALTGGLTIGYDAGGGTGATQSNLTVSGPGSMSITGATVNISVNQAATNAAYWSAGILNLTNLTGGFSANVTTFNLGVGTTTTGQGTLLLTNTTNSIVATTLQVGNSGGNNAGPTAPSLIQLGTGTNTINADTINLGFSKYNGTIQFASQTAGSPGTVTIGGKTGANAAITISSNNGTGTGAVTLGVLDLRGHNSTVAASTLAIGISNNTLTGGSTGTLDFDTGTFTANSVNMASKSGTAGTGAATATINLSGGSFTVNSGGSFVLATNSATTGSAVATLNITGGILTSNDDITRGGGTATTATVTLNGGTLDMENHNIGGATTITTLNFQAGTLENVNQINAGAGLTKTNATTLILENTGAFTNNYTGGTVISAGTVQVGSGSTTGTLGAGNVSGTGTLAFNRSNSYSVSNVITGSVALQQNGPGTTTLAAASNYTGATQVNAGTLVVSGSISGSATTVATGATLAGGANLTSQVGTITVNSDGNGGGTLAPGNVGGVGVLTAVGNVALGVAATAGVAHLAIEIGQTTAGTTYDQLAITTGTLSLNNVELDGSLINGFLPKDATTNGGGQFSFDGDTFYIVTGASSIVNAAFANQGPADPGLLGFPTVSFGGQEFAISFAANFNNGSGSTFATGGHDIALMAIPEPNSLAMLAGSFGLALGLQRFRRRK